MHNLTKIKLFRIILYTTYPLALLFLYPFALIKRKNHSKLFFFFDRYSIGGAQKIFLDVLKSVEDIKKPVYFTRLSVDGQLKDQFYSLPNTECKDIHLWCDYLLFRIFTIHYYAFYINRHTGAHVFSSNSTFFFDMLPFLRKSIKTTELLHNFSYGKKGFEFFGLANCKYLSNRIVYDNLTLENIRKQYKEYSIPESIFNRVHFIEPGVFIPPPTTKSNTPPLKVLYAGRGGRQKRVWLINKIVEHFISLEASVAFEFAGTMEDELSDKVKQHSHLHGRIDSQEKMYEIYKEAHIILLASAFEGFPMVIKEGMACGCVPLVTALEGNKTHLTNRQNGLLIEAITDEDKVIEQGIKLIQELIQHPELVSKLSENSYHYACKHFQKEHFIKECRKLLTQ